MIAGAVVDGGVCVGVDAGALLVEPVQLHSTMPTPRIKMAGANFFRCFILIRYPNFPSSRVSEEAKSPQAGGAINKQKDEA